MKKQKQTPLKQPTKAGTFKIAGSILGCFLVLALLGSIFGSPKNEDTLLAASISSSIGTSSIESSSTTSQQTSSLSSSNESSAVSNPGHSSSETSSNSQSSKISSQSSSKKPSGNPARKPNSSSSSSSKPQKQQAPTSSSKPAPQKQNTAPAQQPQQSTMVWIPQSGEKYHRRSGCSGMKNPTQQTLEWAKSHGYTPCKKCYG